MVTVANLRKVKFGEHIGRPTILGNPFIIGTHGTREEVIDLYRVWLDEQIAAQNDIYDELIRLLTIAREGDLILLCWCAPKLCHGNCIKDWIDHQLQLEKLNE